MKAVVLAEVGGQLRIEYASQFRRRSRHSLSKDKREHEVKDHLPLPPRCGRRTDTSAFAVSPRQICEVERAVGHTFPIGRRGIED